MTIRNLPFALSLFCFLSLGVAAPLRAEVRAGDSVLVKLGEVIEGNLYATGATITVHGVVKGDLVAAGGTIYVDGPVGGDVLAVGGQLTLAGLVDGDVRGMAGQVSLLAPIGGDAALGGGNVHVGADVAGDALVASGSASIGGAVGRGLYVASGDTRVASRVGGDLIAQGGRLTLEDGAQVNGDVRYAGPEDVVRESGSLVAGAIIQRPLPGAGPRWLMTLLGWVQLLVGMFVLGLLWLTLFRGFAQRSMHALRTRPALSFGVGTAVLLGTPPAIGLVLVLGSVLGGAWLGLFGLAIYGMAIALTFPFIAATLGLAVTRRAPIGIGNLWWPLLGALVPLTILMQVPVLGPLVALACATFGLGAIAVTLLPTLRFTRSPTVETAPLPSTPAAPARSAA